jgi:methylmalonyl-CoA mutase cobalamin-binding subunit
VSTRLHPLVLLAILAFAAGCDETLISVSSDGRIEVAVRTNGSDVDTDGFSVTVDGGTARFVAPGGSVILDSLSQGSHSVLLSGLAENCQVEGTNPRPVVVGPDGQADVSFDVRCARATTGGFTIQVSTSGEAPDTDGYALAVAGADIRGIGPGASETFTGLTPGAHLVTLKDVDEPCAVTGGNPQLFTVIAGKTVLVRLAVACGASLP